MSAVLGMLDFQKCRYLENIQTGVSVHCDTHCHIVEDGCVSSLSDGQYEYAAVAAACATYVSGVPARRMHKDVHGSWSRDQTGRNRDFQLLSADNRGAEGRPVDDNDRGRNKLAAIHHEHSTLLHLSKLHRAGRK
jgi:hypothetical protein